MTQLDSISTRSAQDYQDIRGKFPRPASQFCAGPWCHTGVVMERVEGKIINIYIYILSLVFNFYFTCWLLCYMYTVYVYYWSTWRGCHLQGMEDQSQKAPSRYASQHSHGGREHLLAHWWDPLGLKGLLGLTCI